MVEGILAASVLAAALLPLLLRVLRLGSLALSALSLVLWIAAPGALLASYGRIRRPVEERETSGRPIAVRGDGYVSSDTCRACHPEQHRTWHASYHRTMTQVVTPETVLGRFDGQDFSFDGWIYRPVRKGDEFWLEIRWSGDPPGKEPRFRRRLVLATGSHHRQTYWYTMEDARKVGLSPLTYSIEDRKWLPEQTAFLRPHEEGMVLREGKWNEACLVCHATASKPRLFGPENVDTLVAEFGIACEACHGPAEEHVRRNRDPLRRYGLHLSGEPDGSIVHPARLSPRLSSQVCGQCHGAWVLLKGDEDPWRQTGHSYRPGQDLETTRHYVRARDDPHLVALFNAEDSFWSDGMIRVTGREYNGLIATPCHTHGDPDRKTMTCLSCHVMHKAADDARSSKEWANDQLAPRMEANDACLQCHDSYRSDPGKHTHHLPQSAGSSCYNCHMPYTSYGLLKAVRSHTVDSPSVAKSIETGRPNACNQCHLDRTLAWAAQKLEEWYGQPQPRLDADQTSIAASVLWTLRGDAGQRALMAWSMGWDEARRTSRSGWMVLYLAQLLMDPYDAVRYIADRSLRRFPGYKDFRYDHLNAFQHKDAVMEEVQRIWFANPSLGQATTGPTLYDPQTGLRSDVYNRLLDQRDERRVQIIE